MFANPLVRVLLPCAVVMLTTSASTLLTRYSQRNGTYYYDPAALNLLTEALKLTLCVCGLIQLYGKDTPKAIRAAFKRDSLYYFGVPSFLYAVQNNLFFFGLKLLPPALFQLMGNLRVLTTALAAKWMLGTQISQVQWAALCLLVVGMCVSQLREDAFATGQWFSGKSSLLAENDNMMGGFIASVFICTLSAVASVWNELALKREAHESIHSQNVVMYTTGIVFNSAFMWVENVNFSQAFSSFDRLSLLIAINLAFGGVAVSMVMKFADNIVKVFANSVSILFTAFISVFLFGLPLTWPLMLSALIVGYASVTYYSKPTEKPKPTPDEEQGK